MIVEGLPHPGQEPHPGELTESAKRIKSRSHPGSLQNLGGHP